MITACVAIDSRGGFGANGTLPWHIPEEFDFYQNHVRGDVCIIGSRSFNDLVKMSISPSGRLYKKCLLKTTTHIVVTRSHECMYEPDIMKLISADRQNMSLYFVNTVESAVLLAKHLVRGGNKDIHFIGGAKIYEEGLKYCDRVYTSVIPATYLECDTFFPTDKLESDYQPTHHSTIKSESHSDIQVLCWYPK